MKNKLKILFFADCAAEHTLRWTKFFANIGHDVHIISWNDLSEAYRNDDVIKSFHPVKLHILGGKRPKSKLGYFFWLISLIFTTRKMFKEIKPDLLHSHSVGSYAWITLFLPKMRSVMTPWGTDVLIDMHKSKINRYLSLKSLKKSTVITVDASHMKERLIQFGIDADKIKIIYFGTDTNFYLKSQASRKKIRSEFGIGENDIAIISTRTLNPIHDVFLTIKAIPHILKSNKNVKFIIASDGSERKDMEQFVLSNNLQEYVFFPGYMTMDQMVAYLSAADIYISSSKADAGLAASTAEAMSVGLPVVVSNNSENSFWIENAGLLFEDGDEEGIAKCILKLLDEPDQAVKLGENGRSRILKDNDYNTEMKKVNELYLKI